MRRVRGLEDTDFSPSQGDVVPLRVGKVVEAANDVAELLIERGMAELAANDTLSAGADDAGSGSEAPAKQTTKKTAKKTTKKTK